MPASNFPGIPSGDDDGNATTGGRLYFQTSANTAELPDALSHSKSDNNILGTALALQQQQPAIHVTVGHQGHQPAHQGPACGHAAEDYANDQVLEDTNLLFVGAAAAGGFLGSARQGHGVVETGSGSHVLPLHGPLYRTLVPNQFLYDDSERAFEAVVRRWKRDSAIIEVVKDYRNARHAVWGINARNREQNFALNLLMDPEIDFVTLLGHAGTGKTLLTLAAALTQTLEEKRYARSS